MARRLHGKVHRIFRKEELHLLSALIAAADLGLHAADNFPDLLKRIGDLADLMRAAVAQALVEEHPVPMQFIGMNDRFGKSGEFEELMAYFGLDSKAIVKAVKRLTAN